MNTSKLKTCVSSKITFSQIRSHTCMTPHSRRHHEDSSIQAFLAELMRVCACVRAHACGQHVSVCVCVHAHVCDVTLYTVL